MGQIVQCGETLALKEGVDTAPPSAYHLFERSGEHFVYHLGAGQFSRIDDSDYEFLCKYGDVEEVEPRGSSDMGCGSAKASTRGLLEELKQSGFFDLPAQRLSSRQVDSALESRFSSKTRTANLVVAIAESCNLSCSYCYCRSTMQSSPTLLMSQDIAHRCVDYLFDESGRAPKLKLTFGGGEPLLNKPVFRFIVDYSLERAKQEEKEIQFFLTTNGTLLDEETVDYICANPFALMVSMDGPKENHDRTRRFKDNSGSFDQVIAGVKRLASHRTVAVRTTYDMESPGLEDIVRFFEELGVSRVVCSPLVAQEDTTPKRNACDAACRLDREEEALLPWLFRQFARGKRPIYFPYDELIFAKVQTGRLEAKPLSLFRCGACHGAAVIGADGSIYPCNRFLGMKQWRLGNIRQGSVQAAGKGFWRGYHQAVEPACSICWARRLCQRPCPWEVAREDGTFAQPREELCRVKQNHSERFAYVLYKLEHEFQDAYETILATGRMSGFL